MSLDGSCECRAVRYRINAVHLHVYACHCLNCQKRSGSAFALHTMLPAAVLDCEGQTVSRERSSNGILFEELFCEMCLCRLFNRNDALPGMLSCAPAHWRQAPVWHRLHISGSSGSSPGSSSPMVWRPLKNPPRPSSSAPSFKRQSFAIEADARAERIPLAHPR